MNAFKGTVLNVFFGVCVESGEHATLMWKSVFIFPASMVLNGCEPDCDSQKLPKAHVEATRRVNETFDLIPFCLYKRRSDVHFAYNYTELLPANIKWNILANMWKSKRNVVYQQC